MGNMKVKIEEPRHSWLFEVVAAVTYYHIAGFSSAEFILSMPSNVATLYI
jgi:hypothetical protein